MDPLALAHAFRHGQVHGPAGPIEARRAMLTRKSLLVFTERSVLKLRRPRVVAGFDQTRLSTRYGMTARERAFGRVLSPGTYLADCALQIHYDGETPFLMLVEGLVDGEPLVSMRRLRDELRADHVLAHDTLGPEAFFPHVDALLRLHLSADAHHHPPLGAPERLPQRVATLVATLPTDLWQDRQPFLDDTLARLSRLTPTLEHRVMEGRVRELHGELQLDHLFVDPSGADPAHGVIIDPRDGSDGERVFDVALDIFRLALALELAVGRAFADVIVERYASLSVDLTLRRVAVVFRRLAALELMADFAAEAQDPEATDPEAATASVKALVEHLGSHPD